MKDPRFPELTHSQITKLKAYGKVENYATSTKVFALGENV
jgi:hypothetical protein